ncbi:MAG: DNA repair protein RecN [Magnetococcales bacterium]|nr:DNA repair protein RecN [Magnetococcales bacterium]MBF0150193.1 DNA repair protein RecN [Magnetococcales bacterium]MBF0347921.1 DNA repair protein RecN [Magnetococcales bacterium]
MLSYLCVENIALIERLDLYLDRGLTILTGETGAGKSIIIDALSLALGCRAESGLLRSGTDKGMVSAHFHLPEAHPIRAWLAQREIKWMEDGLFLRRVLTDKGRSRAFINEMPVPLAVLAEAGEMIAEIHGQHDNQSLLNGVQQRQLLDTYADQRQALDLLAQRYRQWREGWEEIQRLETLVGKAGGQRELLTFQIGELLEVAPQPGEMATLEGQGQRLQHGAQLVQGAARALEAILESPVCATAVTHEAASSLEALTRIDAELLPLATALRSLHYELEDCGVRLRHYLQGLETDPEQLEALKSRLDRIHRLSRKHHVESEGLLDLAERLQKDLDALEHVDERREQLFKQLELMRRHYDEQAVIIRQGRQQAAQALMSAVERQLADLHMAKTRFAIQVLPLTGDPRPEGMDDIHFLVSANPQEPLRPLKQVASGGELSRIMLAIKTVLTDTLPANTLVFDEVDVGIGGRVAASLGEKLAKVALGRQVLTITHLPQVAAFGHAHLCIRKEIVDDKARVGVESLNHGQRVEELARMLAGNRVTAAAREHARDLLANAGQPVGSTG